MPVAAKRGDVVKKRRGRASKAPKAKKPKAKPKARSRQPKGFSRRVVKKVTSKPSKSPKGFSSEVVAAAFGEKEKHPHGFPKKVVQAVMKAAVEKLTEKQREWRRKRRQAKLDALDAARRKLRKAEADRKKLERSKAPKTKKKRKAAEVRARAREVEQKAAEIQEQASAQQRREHGFPADFTEPASDELIETWQQNFSKLLEIAGRTGQLSKKDYGPERIWREKVRTDREGDTISHRINVELDESTVEEVLYQIQRNADRLPGSRNIWMISLAYCSMGSSLIGYGQRILEADNQDDAHNFQMGFETTGVWKTKVSMMAKVRALLEEYASDMTTLVFLNRYTVWNFDFVVAGQ